ncbi:MAG TPA: hypothetical protein VF017_05875 [Thermoanaerobaculia bacterium]|nr:hypothetical protein [Thermoanaerobaculia bacterium]
MNTKFCRAMTASLLLITLVAAFASVPAQAAPPPRPSSDEPASALALIETLIDRLTAWVGSSLGFAVDASATPDPDPIPPADDDAGFGWDPNGRIL